MFHDKQIKQVENRYEYALKQALVHYDLQLTRNVNDSSIYRALAIMYSTENWFVILLSRV